MEEDIEKEVVEEVVEGKDMTPILVKDLDMMYTTKTSKKKSHYGIFQCQYCGKEFKSVISNVKNGNTKSCGCYKITEITKHGLSNHKFYCTWNDMRGRCYNLKNTAYPNYGGRGITVCKEWHDIKNFVKWAEETYIEGMSLDRIDNDKGYSTDNCRWVDAYTQNINQRKQRNNTSGYVGVKWNKKGNKWEASIYINKKYKYLGVFKDKMDAVKARDEYIIENNLPHKLSIDY